MYSKGTSHDNRIQDFKRKLGFATARSVAWRMVALCMEHYQTSKIREF